MAPWRERGRLWRWLALAGVAAAVVAAVAWGTPGRRRRDRAVERHATLAVEFDRIAEQHRETAGAVGVGEDSADPALLRLHRRMIEYSRELARQARENAAWHARRARELARRAVYDDRRDGEADRLQEALERGQRVWALVEGGVLDSEIRRYLRRVRPGGPRRAPGPAPVGSVARGPRAEAGLEAQRPSGEVSARATCLAPSNFDSASVRNLM